MSSNEIALETHVSISISVLESGTRGEGEQQRYGSMLGASAGSKTSGLMEHPLDGWITYFVSEDVYFQSKADG